MKIKQSECSIRRFISMQVLTNTQLKIPQSEMLTRPDLSKIRQNLWFRARHLTRNDPTLRVRSDSWTTLSDLQIDQLESVLWYVGTAGSILSTVRSHLWRHSKQITLASDSAANFVMNNPLTRALVACTVKLVHTSRRGFRTFQTVMHSRSQWRDFISGKISLFHGRSSRKCPSDRSWVCCSTRPNVPLIALWAYLKD